MSNTILINIYGAAGSGKSTTALGLTHSLKLEGYKVEYVSEYAKDLVSEGSSHKLKHQLYVFAKQLKKLEVLMDKGLDFVVTDSPLLLSYFYGNKYKTIKPYFKDLVQTHLDDYKCYNIFLKRNVPYDSSLRVQTEQESDQDSNDLRELLDSLDMPYFLGTSTFLNTGKGFKKLLSALNTAEQYSVNLEDKVQTICNVLTQFTNTIPYYLEIKRQGCLLTFPIVNLGRRAGHSTALNFFANRNPHLKIGLITTTPYKTPSNIHVSTFKSYNKNTRGHNYDLLVVDHGYLNMTPELEHYIRATNLDYKTILLGE